MPGGSFGYVVARHPLPMSLRVTLTGELRRCRGCGLGADSARVVQARIHARNSAVRPPEAARNFTGGQSRYLALPGATLGNETLAGSR